MRNRIAFAFIILQLTAWTATAAVDGGAKELAEVGSAPIIYGNPKSLCSPKSTNAICKKPVKLNFKWSNDGVLASSPQIITRWSNKASVTSGGHGRAFTIEVLPEYSKLSSKEGLHMKLRLLIDNEVVAEPELFSKLGEVAQIRIDNDAKFKDFESLEIAVTSEMVK